MRRIFSMMMALFGVLILLCGCDDEASTKTDDTTAIDILNIDTTSPDRAGLYQLYWIPLPTGQEFTTTYAGHEFTNNEYEYKESQNYNFIDNNVTVSLNASGEPSSVKKYIDKAYEIN